MSLLSELRRFRSGTLAELADDCARLVGLVEQELAGLRAWGWERPRPTGWVSGEYRAKFGELIHIDDSSIDTVIYLPKPGPKDAGRGVFFVRRTGTAAVTARPTAGTTLNNDTAPVSFTTTLAFRGILWTGQVWRSF